MTTERWRDTLARRRLESKADATRFFELARGYARLHGVRKLGSICGYCAVPAFVYEDALVIISVDVDGPALEIVFKYPDGRLTNPVVMVTEKGENIRTHGEHCYVVPHIEALVASSAEVGHLRRRLARYEHALREIAKPDADGRLHLQRIAAAALQEGP